MVEVPMWRILVSGGVLVIAAVGCHHAVEINAKQPIPVGSRWTATLATPDALRGAVQIHGSAWMGPPAVGDTARALIAIQIANAAPGGVHPWGVHEGTCGNDRGIYGAGQAYPPLKVGSDGAASGKAQQTIPLPKAGEYFVEVLAAQNNAGTVIACGNMAPPSG